MRSKYIKIQMDSINTLRTNIGISIGSLEINNIKDVNVKIDTGCPYTSIPIQKLGLSKEYAQLLKLEDCKRPEIKKETSFGVNDTERDRQIAIRLFKAQRYEQLKQVTFIHTDLKLDFNGVVVNKNSVKISYDRVGNILIGMDILKDWDIHIGTIDTGETIFLGCPKDQINEQYLQELENIFHIYSDINASIIRQKLM